MADTIVIMPGLTRPDFSKLSTVAGEFGWQIAAIDDPGRLADIEAEGEPVALLVYPDALGYGHSWREAIRLLRATMPVVPVIVCQGFADSIDWQELADAGVFHTLWLPLKENEMRQSFGFLSPAASKKLKPRQQAKAARSLSGAEAIPISRFSVASASAL